MQVVVASVIHTSVSQMKRLQRMGQQRRDLESGIAEMSADYNNILSRVWYRSRQCPERVAVAWSEGNEQQGNGVASQKKDDANLAGLERAGRPAGRSRMLGLVHVKFCC
jgi:hypothetical protein